MATALTDAAVRKYRPSKKRREIRDSLSQGLYLVIQPSGSLSWAMRFRRPDGSPGKLTLGPVDLSRKEAQSEPVLGAPLTLAAARALASEVHRQRAMGRDVITDYVAKKQRLRVESQEAIANSFGALAPQFIGDYAQPKTRRWRATARMLGLRYAKDGGEPEISPTASLSAGRRNRSATSANTTSRTWSMSPATEERRGLCDIAKGQPRVRRAACSRRYRPSLAGSPSGNA